jgi:Ca-activated chloride channel family protein
MMYESPNMDDLHDKLVDCALREVVGGESPPDLSDRILSAAKNQADTACGLAATTRGDEAMNDQEQPRKRSHWVGRAIAGGLLVVTGTLLLGALLLLPAQQASRQLTPSEAARFRRSIELAAGKRSEALTKLNRYLIEPDHGQGPGNSGDQYSRIHENQFQRVSIDSTENRLSTFSIDVDTAAYANVRQFLLKSNRLPPADAVRIEELVNYFDYNYPGPTDDVPFAANIEVASCPWQPAHRLVRVGIKGREIAREKRPLSNLVFLIDVSGSMNQPNKLPLLVQGMKMLTRELGENDRVAIAVYASSEGLALPSTPGDKQDVIRAALEKLRAGGSTAGGAGIALAYKTARQNFIEGGVNRVILCTDGDFNVGVTSPAALERMAEQQAKETGVFLTVLGFGRGNLNDAMMEKISGKGNGNYHYIDGLTEARKVLVEEMAGTLVTIAKDVKIQIEFNPAKVASYRLIGYENRVLVAEDFNDDKKDAGEIGAGHTVTALYEIVPAGQSVDSPSVDALKYGQPAQSTSDEVGNADVDGEVVDEEVGGDELLTLKIRYKLPDGDTSTKLEFPLTDHGLQFTAAPDDFKFAAAVASFGMLLRNSEYRGSASYASVLEIAEDVCSHDPHEYRAEFLQIVRRAQQLAGE